MMWLHKNKAKLMSFSPPFVFLASVMQVSVAALFIGLVCHAAEPPASQWSSDEHRNITLRRHRTCVENEQYLHQALCCLNCQAGREENAPASSQVLTTRQK